MGGSASKADGPLVHILPAERAGESSVYRHISAKDALLNFLDDDVKTLYDSFTFDTFFDFSHFSKVTEEELQLYINIQKKINATFQLDVEESKKLESSK